MKPEPMQHANALPSSQSPLVKWLDRYGNAATIVACVAMIGGAIWYSYSRTSTSRREAAWAQYHQARTAADFGNIADVYGNTEVGGWARLSEGERLLESGSGLMFTDRAAALGDLKKSEEVFLKVLEMKSAPAGTRERALWGLAKAIETQSDGDTTKAIEAYQALLREFPSSIYKGAAEERIEALKSPEAREFYAWFHQENPKPADRGKPSDGLPEGHPPIDLPSDKGTETDKSKTDSQTKAIDLEPTLVERLKSEVEIKFEKTPLQDAIQFIADKCEVPIELDGDALKEAGLTKNMPQTLDLGKTTGLEALAAILKKSEGEKSSLVLVLRANQEKALITTSKFAKNNDLTPFDFSKPADADPPKLSAPNQDKPKPDAPRDDQPKDEKPKADEPKPESKEKDPPAEAK
jgi:tetratricopeptide (TPR) repeat protein